MLAGRTHTSRVFAEGGSHSRPVPWGRGEWGVGRVGRGGAVGGGGGPGGDSVKSG